ncbi:perlucin-like protein [Dreissena polymorpha]|uniref:perlucin-like protein n=1 Tax=Dreissena polymorpha TaxID=45954 RepID=UPI002264073A|nr:perlucin-like protein [Dreissena polymorpha]
MYQFNRVFVNLSMKEFYFILNCECPVQQCPDGWTTFRGSCYYVSDNVSVDWTEAVHHCELHHGRLVTIETKEEDSSIRSHLERLYRQSSQHVGEEFWLGANDQMVEGVWTWYTNDQPLEYIGWYPGQPGSVGDEDCAVIASRLEANGSQKFNGWHDAPCAAKHRPVCEIRHDNSISIVVKEVGKPATSTHQAMDFFTEFAMPFGIK